VDLLVASGTQRDEVPLGILTEQAAQSNLMRLEFTHGSAILVQRQPCCFSVSLLDHEQLTLVDPELDQLPSVRFLSTQVAI